MNLGGFGINYFIVCFMFGQGMIFGVGLIDYFVVYQGNFFI